MSDDRERIATLLGSIRNHFNTEWPAVVEQSVKVLMPAFPTGEEAASIVWDEERIWNLVKLSESMVQLEKELKS